MSASISLEGQPATLPLGTLAVQLPPPVLAGAPASAPAPASPPVLAPEESQLDLGHLSWSDLAIPGHPTVAVPGLGDVASGKLVAAGLLLLVLLIFRELLHRPFERAERRRALDELEAARFGGYS
jgi:hypothetical protein